MCAIRLDNTIDCGRAALGSSRPPEGEYKQFFLYTRCAVNLDNAITCWALSPDDIVRTPLDSSVAGTKVS